MTANSTTLHGTSVTDHKGTVSLEPADTNLRKPLRLEALTHGQVTALIVQLDDLRREMRHDPR